MPLLAIRRWGAWLGLVAASLLTSAQAQDPQQAHTGVVQPTQAARSDQFADVRVSELIGMDVRNNAQRRIGDVEDVLIDLRTGEVRYAVLAYGGHMGLGETLFAYPTSAFAVDLQTGLLVLKLPDERLGKSEGFARGRWPASDDAAFWQRIENLFAGDRRFERPEGRHMMRGSELLQTEVNDRAGQALGQVRDVVLNLGRRQVQFVVVALDRAWSLDKKLVAVPLSAFDASTAQSNALTLEHRRERLLDAPPFNRARWPDLTQEGLRERYESYWNNAPTPLPELSTAFRLLDRNGDGILTYEEYDQPSSATTIDPGSGGPGTAPRQDNTGEDDGGRTSLR